MGIIKKAITALFLGFVLLLLFSALGPAFFGVLFLFLLFWLIWRFRSQWHLKPAHRNILIVLFLIVVGFAVWVVLFSMSPGITMLLTFLVLAFGVITWGGTQKRLEDNPYAAAVQFYYSNPTYYPLCCETICVAERWRALCAMRF